MSWLKTLAPRIICRGYRQELAKRSIHYCVLKNVNITSKLADVCENNKISYNIIRQASKKKQYDSDDDDGGMIDDDSSLSRDSKIVKFNTTSMRIDAILKSAMGVSRNKVEQMFYESKIRVNGKKILKKSASVKVGDEVDVLKLVSPNNPEHLYVGRVEILNVTPKEENITVTARRFKHLLIDNYGSDPHKAAAESES